MNRFFDLSEIPCVFNNNRDMLQIPESLSVK